MIELHDLGASYQDVYDRYQAAVDDARRQWAARLLRTYPHRSRLEIAAAKVRYELDTSAVEINALGDAQQTTVAKAPSHEEVVIPDSDSLCVLTVGSGRASEVSDIQADARFLGSHNAVKLGLGSWASVPIFIEGCAAGTICALEADNPRVWTAEDQRALEHAAEDVSQAVTEWSLSEPHSRQDHLAGES